MVGNSLLDEFMGVKLFNPEQVKAQASGKKMLGLFEEDPQGSLFENDDKKTADEIFNNLDNTLLALIPHLKSKDELNNHIVNLHNLFKKRID